MKAKLNGILGAALGEKNKSWNPKCNCKIAVLPNNMIIFEVFILSLTKQIFPFFDLPELCKMEQVCRRMRFLSSDKKLWREFNFRIYPQLLQGTKENLIRFFSKRNSL
jgi:hypothetical protein